jgi:hypothetical protein
MPAPVVVAHDDEATCKLVVAALIAAGLTAVGFHDLMAPLDAVEEDSRVRVLVTRIDFGAGKLNGVAFARMLKLKRPDVRLRSSLSRFPKIASTPRGWGSSCRFRSCLTYRSIQLVAC